MTQLLGSRTSTYPLLETIRECHSCTWGCKEFNGFNSYMWMTAPTTFEMRTIKQQKSLHIKEEVTEYLVTASTAIDNNNGIDKPNSTVTIVKNEAVAELVQANMTNINCTPQPTERHSVPVQATNMTNINCTLSL